MQVSMNCLGQVTADVTEYTSWYCTSFSWSSGFCHNWSASLRSLRVFLCLLTYSDATFLNCQATETRTWSFMYVYQKTYASYIFACFLSSVACNVCSGFSVWTITLWFSKIRPRWSYKTKNNNRKKTNRKNTQTFDARETILTFIHLKYLATENTELKWYRIWKISIEVKGLFVNQLSL